MDSLGWGRGAHVYKIIKYGKTIFSKKIESGMTCFKKELPYCNFVDIISIESCIIYSGLKISGSSSDVQEITWFFANGI